MRVPGIRTIAVAECKNIPADLEITAASGLQPNVSGVSFTAVPFVGDPNCDIEYTNENNGAASSVKMTFCLPFRANYRRHCFAVGLATGETYLIGSKESIPMVTCKDTAAGPGTTNQCVISVELSAFMAWIPLGNVLATPSGEGSTPVGFEPWREITSTEIDEIINGLT